MTTHSSILAWTEELGGLQSTGSQRAGHNCSTKHTHILLIGEGQGNPLAWRIPWTEEAGWLQCIGSHRVGHD